jgi:hypothetical protein
MEIYLSSDRRRVLVYWGRGTMTVLHSDGTVTEQSRVEGELVWSTFEPGYDAGYAKGNEEGYREGYAQGLNEGRAAAQKAKAS